MQFQTFAPADILKPFIKHYWIFTTDQAIDDAIYPSGYLELAINISDGRVTSVLDDRYIKMPSVEVLGQLTSPARIVTNGKTRLLVARFYPHATSLFFPNRISSFTNDSIDLLDVFKEDAIDLYSRLMDQRTLLQKISILDAFLVKQLTKNQKSVPQTQLIHNIVSQAAQSDAPPDIENIALQYGFSARYIQKLFLDYVGLTPKRFFNIRRFNRSLDLVRTSGASLTSIAYECGYYDQAHFIKEFKTFTGLTPSQVQQPDLTTKTTEN